jgi:putative endopeptidase
MNLKHILASTLLITLSAHSFSQIKISEPAKGICLTSLDTTVNPRENFYLFANGNWLRNNPIPETEGAWNSFSELKERNEKILRNILEEAAANKNAPKGSISQKIGDFYFTAMDSVKRQKDGLAPLKPYLARIEGIKDRNDIIGTVGFFHSYGIAAMFGLGVMQDAKKSDSYISYIGQGGLGLPDRDYYLKEDEKSVNIRKEYQSHLVKTFELLGYPKSKAQDAAKKIMNIEIEFAKASMTKVELRNFETQYNKMTTEEFQRLTPLIPWDKYFKGTGLGKIDEVIVTQPLFFEQLNIMIDATNLEDWKIYLKWHLIKSTSNMLSDTFVQHHFDFYSTVLSGIKEMKPRWKRALAASNEVLGEAVGQAYVEKNFSSESKKRVNEMVDNLILAFRARINNLDWMSDSTQQKALLKLQSFTRKLGYPDKWKDYSAMQISRDSYLENYLNARKFLYNEMTGKLGKAIDKTEWQMPPQTINAYYNPLLNEIVFPAGIMQPPFFNPDADDAVNYGSMGAVIGHELTHGFDDQGSKFDSNGNMVNWWSEEDKEKFNAKTQVLIDQFNNYVAVDDLKVNGQLTLGENIADLGGLSMAYDAFKMSLKGKQGEVINGFTAEQRFFIGWAQVWKSNFRPETLRNKVLTDPHSPGIYRVLGPLSNLPEFHEAFGVKPGDAMYLEEPKRANIW